MEEKTVNEIFTEVLTIAELKEREELLLENSRLTPNFHNDTLNFSRIALLHLLKMIYQPSKQSSSWIGSIKQGYMIVYKGLITDRGKLNSTEYELFISKFSEISRSAIHYASLDTGMPESNIKLTYGMSPRIFMSKEWLINFMDIILQKEPLRTNTIKPTSEFMVDINSLPNPNKFTLNKINKELGEPEIYG